MADHKDPLAQVVQKIMEMVGENRPSFGGFKIKQGLMLAGVAAIAVILGTAWFTVQPKETGIV